MTKLFSLTIAWVTALAAFTLIASSAGASVISINTSGVYASNEKDNYGGNTADLVDGSGMTETNPNDPSTWTDTASSYKDEWEALGLLDSTTSANNKIAWVILDLGSATANLDSLYLWNLRDSSASRDVKDYNLYYSTSPTTTVTHGPTNSTASDYNFASGGWTQIGSTKTLALAGANSGSAEGVDSLGGVTARYVGIEILSNTAGTDGTTTGARTGLSEVGVTYTPVPEPASLGLALVGLGLLGFRRRKRVA